MQAKQPRPEQKDTEQTQRKAELWLREHSLGIRESQQAALTQLQDLAQNGHFDALSVHTWSKHIAITTSESPNQTAAGILDSIREFKAWTDRNDYSLPGFQRHTQSSLGANTTREVIAPPLLCLAVYEDEMLSEVIPHSGPEGHLTVPEWLQSVASNDDS
jgi:hypothetical protein